MIKNRGRYLRRTSALVESIPCYGAVFFFFTFFDVMNTLIYHVLFAVELKPQLILFLLSIIVYRLRLWKTSKPKKKSQVQSIQTDLQYVIFNHGQLLKS
jgi:hypothetical protein